MKIWHRVNWGLIAAVLGLCAAGDVIAGTGGDEFSDVWETLKEWIQGTLGRVIAGSMILVGIVAGIFGIAKLIEILMRKWKGRTYCAILGMVLASPVAILMDTSIYKGFSLWICVASVVALAAGALIAFKLGGDPEPKKA